MEAKSFCGLDFGTSNSTVALQGAQGVELAPLEGESRTLPSSIYFAFPMGSRCSAAPRSAPMSRAPTAV